MSPYIYHPNNLRLRLILTYFPTLCFWRGCVPYKSNAALHWGPQTVGNQKPPRFVLTKRWRKFAQTLTCQEALNKNLGALSLEDFAFTPKFTFNNKANYEIKRNLILWLFLWDTHLFVNYLPFNNKSYQFIILFNWLYSNQFGSFMENQINSLLKKEATKTNFHDAFLLLQTHAPYLFNTNVQIGSHTLGVRRLVFSKTNLAKIIRLILANYNCSYWLALTAKQRFQLIYKLVETTRQLGNYNLINKLFSPIDPESSALLYGLPQPNFLEPTSVGSEDSKLICGCPPTQENMGLVSLLHNVLRFGLYAQILGLVFGNLPNVRATRLTLLDSQPQLIRSTGIISESFGSPLPFAAISMSNKFRAPLNRGSDRTSGQVSALQVSKPLNDPSRNNVTLFVSSNGISPLVSGKKPQVPVNVIGYWEENSVPQIAEYSATAEVTNKGISLTAKDGTPFIDTLYKTTPLGVNSIDNQKGPTRNLLTSLAVVDLDNSTPVEISLVTDYNQKDPTKIRQHFSKQISKATVALHKSMKDTSCRLSNLKTLEKSALISKTTHDLEAIKSLDYASCHAGHALPKRTGQIIGQDHESAVTVYTNRFTNGSSVADNQEVNTFVPQVGGTVAELFVANIPLMREKAHAAVMLRRQTSSKDNFFALALLADLDVDSYKEMRLVTAKNYTAEVMSPYEFLSEGCADLKSIFADKLAYYSFFTDCCSENCRLFLDILKKQQATLTFNVLMPSQKKGYITSQNSVFNLAKTMQSPEDLNESPLFKDIQSALTTVETEAKGLFDSLTLEKDLNALSLLHHSLLTNRTVDEANDLLKTKTTLVSSGYVGTYNDYVDLLFFDRFDQKKNSSVLAQLSIRQAFNTYSSNLSHQVAFIDKEIIKLEAQSPNQATLLEIENLKAIKVFFLDSIYQLDKLSKELNNLVTSYRNGDMNCATILEGTGLDYTDIVSTISPFYLEKRPKNGVSLLSKLRSSVDSIENGPYNQNCVRISGNIATSGLVKSSIVKKRVKSQGTDQQTLPAVGGNLSDSLSQNSSNKSLSENLSIASDNYEFPQLVSVPSYFDKSGNKMLLLQKNLADLGQVMLQPRTRALRIESDRGPSTLEPGLSRTRVMSDPEAILTTPLLQARNLRDARSYCDVVKADTVVLAPKKGPGRPRKVANVQVSTEPVTVKRGPGRPRKTENVQGSTEPVIVKKGPGRPRKTT